MTWHLLGGVYLGWSLGANDTANIFGTAVSSRALKFMTAAILSGVFVTIGALLEGEAGVRTIGALSNQSLASATYVSVSAAIAITLMTLLRIPTSTSQAVVGSILGIGLLAGGLNLAGLPKVIICWLGTPIGAMLIAMPLYRLAGNILNRVQLTVYSQDFAMRFCLIVVGCYGAYALGANNVANVTAVYYSAGMLDSFTAALIGGLSIALGAITYSKPVMLAVGRGIIRVDGFSALVVVLSEAITVHIYAWIGVPVSTSQAVVGALIGVGLVKQASAIDHRAVFRICLGWLATPVIAALLAIAIYLITHLKYVP